MNTQTNNRTIFVVVIILAIILGFLIYAFGGQKTSATPNPSSTPIQPAALPTPISLTPTEQALRIRADGFLLAVKEQNLEQIKSFMHPTSGVRFTMNTMVSASTDKRFTRTQLQNYFNTNVKFTWGTGASGEPVITTMKNYLGLHVYNQEYLNAPEITFNEFKGQSTINNNAEQVYPNAQIIGFYFPGFDAQYGGLDWQALRLAFEQYKGQWYVVGVIHDYWSP